MPKLNLVSRENAPDNMPLIEMTINKTKHLFLVDTGCSHSMFAKELLGGMEIKPIGASEALGVGGSHIAFIMPVRFNFCGVSLPELSVGPALPPGVSGLIGQDLLQKFSIVEFNNRERTVTLIP